MQIRLVEKKEIYEICDFKKEDFPISYDESEFPQGIHYIRIIYGKNNKPERIFLEKRGIFNHVEDIKSSDMEKILEFIKKYYHPKETKTKHYSKSVRIGIPTLEEAVEITRRMSNI